MVSPIKKPPGRTADYDKWKIGFDAFGGNMNWVKSTSVAILLALSACNDSAVTLDTSSDEALKASLEKMRETLPEDKKDKLSKAILALTFGEMINTSGVLAAGEAAKSPNAISTMSEPLKGKTADEIIQIADSRAAERKTRQLAATESEILKLREDLEKAENNLALAQGTLNALHVSNATFYIQKNQFSNKPVISFTLKNNSSIPVKRIFAKGLLETPGRSVPWVEDEFNYDIPGGLEPGEGKNFDLAPNMFSKWGNDEIANRNDLVLTVTITNIEKAGGDRLVNVDDGDLARKRDRLSSLEKQKAALSDVNASTRP